MTLRDLRGVSLPGPPRPTLLPLPILFFKKCSLSLSLFSLLSSLPPKVQIKLVPRKPVGRNRERVREEKVPSRSAREAVGRKQDLGESLSDTVA